jgi:hypothetical protein
MIEYIVELPDKPAKVVRDGWNVRIEWDFKQREEIVRCRDCAKADWVAAIGHGGFTCRVHGWTSDSVDGYCWWGERRDS